MDETGTRRLRVLIVEDHDDLRELLTQFLTTAGYDVAGARCADTALEMASSWPFDLALIDIGLPHKDGIQLMRELRSVVAVALSGYGMESHVRACRDAGFAAHLLKPVAAETLLEVLHGLRAA
jgi:CheY-like chemotaxis protein